MATDIKVTFDASEVVERLAALNKQLGSKLESALYGVGQKVRLDSMRRTPVDTGALKSSHTVSRPVTRNDRISVTIGAGGPAADYAVYVHEDLSKRHPVGEAKFLEKAVLEEASTFDQDLAAGVKVLL